MSTFTFLPHDLWRIIWIYAYNCTEETRPLRDLAFCSNAQTSIPEIFLCDRVPLLSWFPHGFKTYPSHRVYQMFPPTPFKCGNPYLPTKLIDSSYNIWSNIPEMFIELLSCDALRVLKTYRGVVRRRLNAFLKSRVTDWNYHYNTIWSHCALSNPENFDCPNEWSRELTLVVTRQLEMAQYSCLC